MMERKKMTGKHTERKCIAKACEGDAVQNMDELWEPDLWDSGRLRNALKRATLRWLGVRVNIMAWRHISIAIFRRWIFDKQVQRMIDEDEGHGEEVDEAF